MATLGDWAISQEAEAFQERSHEFQEEAMGFAQTRRCFFACPSIP